MSRDHSWPCSPFSTPGGPMRLLARIAWLELQRCEGCGLLWEIPDRGAHRRSMFDGRRTFGYAIELPRASLLRSDPATVEAITATLNQGRLYELFVTTTTGSWRLADRGVMTPVVAIPGGARTPLSPHDALALVADAWGREAAAALRLALATGFDEEALRTLDIVQGFARTDWEHPWQPGTVELVHAMLDAAPEQRGPVAAGIGLARGIPASELQTLALLPG